MYFKETLIIILSLTSIGCLAIIQFQVSNPTIVVEKETITEQSYWEQELYCFFDIAEKFADSHEYHRADFNCRDYSCGFEDVVEELGYDVQIVRGCPLDGDCHFWVRLVIDIEPINGIIVDYSDMFPVQHDFECKG